MEWPKSPVSGRLLLAGGSPVLESALRQVFELFDIPVQTVSDNSAAEFVDGFLKAGSSGSQMVPVIAASPSLWKTLRPANIWNDTDGFVRSGNFSHGANPNPEVQPSEDAQLPLVLAACAPDGFSLYDLLATDGAGISTLLCDVLKALRVATLPQLDQLKRAALRRLAAERHRLKVKRDDGMGSHSEHDFHAAIRIIHGASLSGWLAPIEAAEAYRAVCSAARASDLLDDQADTESGLLFFNSIPREWTTQGNRSFATPFATLLVVDDQSFWMTLQEKNWADRGIRVEHASNLAGLLRVKAKVSRQLGTGHSIPPVRAVLLDLKFRGGPAHGGTLIQALRTHFPGAPIIGLSVEDVFSVTVMLKKRGLFCYLNKRALSEERGYRDEMAAFGQLRDAVLLACYASVAGDIRRLWDSAFLTQLTVVSRTADEGQGDRSLNVFMASALDKLIEECRWVFHATWQDASYTRGLAYRQIIRSFGLVNDRWCEYYKQWYFDPDQPWPGYYHTRFWPHRAYHHINNLLRNEASHAIVPDSCFEWLDVWIMVLAMLLKAEGLARGDLPHGEIDRKLRSVVRTSWSLLWLSGHLNEPPYDSKQPIEECMRGAARTLHDSDIWRKQHIRNESIIEHPVGSGREVGVLMDRDFPMEMRVAVWPYILRAGKESPLVGEMDLMSDPLRYRRPAQLEADLLVLTMVGARMKPFIEGHLPGKVAPITS